MPIYHLRGGRSDLEDASLDTLNQFEHSRRDLLKASGLVALGLSQIGGCVFDGLGTFLDELFDLKKEAEQLEDAVDDAKDLLTSREDGMRKPLHSSPAQTTPQEDYLQEKVQIYPSSSLLSYFDFPGLTPLPKNVAGVETPHLLTKKQLEQIKRESPPNTAKNLVERAIGFYALSPLQNLGRISNEEIRRLPSYIIAVEKYRGNQPLTECINFGNTLILTNEKERVAVCLTGAFNDRGLQQKIGKILVDYKSLHNFDEMFFGNGGSCGFYLLRTMQDIERRGQSS